MSKKESWRGSNLRRYMKKPFKFLMKARDMYVQGMVECSRNFVYVDAAMRCPTTGVHFCSLPKSFSVDSTRSTETNGDFKQLIRAASLGIRSGDHRVELGAKAMKVSRSRGVGMGRIEEDELFEFGDDTKPLLYQRSRSYGPIGSGARMF